MPWNVAWNYGKKFLGLALIWLSSYTMLYMYIYVCRCWEEEGLVEHTVWIKKLLDSTWLDSTRLDLTWLDLTRLKSTWLNLNRLDLTWLDLTWLNSTQLDLTQLDLTHAMSAQFFSHPTLPFNVVRSGKMIHEESISIGHVTLSVIHNK